MSNKGIYRRWDLDVLRSRCTDEGECWVWQQATNSNSGNPVAVIHGKYVQVRRWVMEFEGRLLPGLVVMSKCGDPRCVNPAHLMMGTSGQASKAAYKRGRRDFKKEMLHRRLGAEAAGFTVLSMDKAREIRRLAAEGTPVNALCERYGVERQAMVKVISGKTWRESANGANVFTWRPAA